VVDESVVASVQQYLRVLKKHGVRVSFGVIFGSQTTGKMDRSSDIDLLVVS
jgi:predicted nucleotidyltransferase